MAKRNVEVEFSLIDGVSKGLGKIDKALGGVGKKLLEISPAALAAAAAVGAIAIGAGLVQGVKSAGDFEAALKEVQAVSGATEDQLIRMREAAISSAESAGFSFIEATEGLGELARATGDVEKAMASLPSVLALAKAGGLGVAEAAEITTTTLTQFGLAAEESGRIADVLAKAANATTSNVQQLGLSLSYAAPLARQLGLDLEPTVAIIGALADQGFRGERAGTALRNVMSALADPASKFSKALDQAGIQSRDFTTIIGELAKRADGGKSVLLALDAEARPAIIALARDGGKAIQGLSKDLDDAAGSAAKTAAVINSGFNASLANLQREIGKFGLNFLEPLLGPLGEQFDALRDKIAEFAASPEFEELRTNFRDAFIEGIDAVKKFASEFDFSAAIASVNEFTKETTAALGTFKTLATETATAVKVVSNTIASAFNAIQVATAAATTGSARLFENITGFFGNFSDTAKESSREIKAFADVAENELGVQVAQLAGNLESLAANFEETAAQTSAATDAQRDAIPVTQQLSEDQIRAANNAKVLADAELKHAEASKAAAAEAQALALGLDALGNVKPITAVDTGVDNIKTAYQETREQIQASIDATKEFTASSKDAAKAVEGIGDAAGDARSQLEEDLSSAVFQGLTEGFGRVTRDLAALRGVSEDVIRGELNNALLGATNTMVGLNNAIKAGDAEIEKLGGTRALEALKKKLDAAAEAAANIGENARNAASELDAMVRALQDSEDARNGDQSSIEKRRFEEELARIAELERASGGTNRAAAELARQLARREHEARLAEINNEGRARVDSELAADQEIADRREAKKKTSASGQLSGSSGQDAFSRQPTNIVINVQALTGQQAIAEAARALADPIEKIRNARI